MANDNISKTGNTQGEAASGQHEMIGNAKDSSQNKLHPDAKWFENAALGIFIHYGLASVHGGIDLSWGMIKNKPWHLENGITPTEYYQLAERFQPNQYDPEKWLKEALKMGVRYAVLTTKHHDGYALWPSKYGELSTKQYMGGRDLVAPFVEACRKLGIKVGFYYSPPDWYFNRSYMTFNYGSRSSKYPDRPDFNMQHEPFTLPAKPEGWEDKYKEYVRNQVEELLTSYGKIDLIWFDGGNDVADAISTEEIRQLQPGIVINARMHGKQGDFASTECCPIDKKIEGVWEHCDEWGNAWGYVKWDENNYRSAAWMLEKLVRIRTWQGSFLINVGPRPEGVLPDVAYQRFAEVAEWMKHSGESVFDTLGGPYPERCNVPVTIKGDIWYLHALPNQMEPLKLSCSSSPIKVKLLRTGQVLDFIFDESQLIIEIPNNLRTELVDVVAVTWL